MMRWILTPFAELSPFDLYALLRLRSEVFVVEQNCVFLDMDDYDAPCQHLLGWAVPDGQPAGGAPVERLAACARLVPPGVKYTEPSIGRVATSPAFRGKGLGRELMVKSLEHLYGLYGVQPVRIGAQRYLLDFYGSLGFAEAGETYLEDGIPHVEMLKRL
jgi:ElaA protein